MAYAGEVAEYWNSVWQQEILTCNSLSEPWKVLNLTAVVRFTVTGLPKQLTNPFMDTVQPCSPVAMLYVPITALILWPSLHFCPFSKPQTVLRPSLHSSLSFFFPCFFGGTLLYLSPSLCLAGFRAAFLQSFIYCFWRIEFIRWKLRNDEQWMAVNQHSAAV